MHSSRRSSLFVVAALLFPVIQLSAQAAAALGFSDPQRVPTLSSTFGDIDRAFREHAQREHIPGAVWAVVIDGRVAHIGVTGSATSHRSRRSTATPCSASPR